VGLYGSSPITSRPLDTFGIGYAFTRYSSPVRDFDPALLPVGNDQVVELFYNIAVTPWFNVAPDLQVVVPARESTFPLPNPHETETALVLGLRAKVEF
jgi:porin